MQVLVSEDLALSIADLLLLILNLLSAHFVILDDLLVSHEVRTPHISLVLILLADQLLRGLTKHALLLAMVFELVLVLDSFLGNLAQDSVALTHAIPALQLLLLLFLRDSLTKLMAVLLLVHRFLLLFVGLVALVRLGLALDDCAPLVKIAFRIAWVIPLIIFSKGLELFAFISQRLLYSLTVQLQRID